MKLKNQFPFVKYNKLPETGEKVKLSMVMQNRNYHISTVPINSQIGTSFEFGEFSKSFKLPYFAKQ